ncbi:hypothetical protein BDN70DRAFT_791287, partial [Pholiota conissans]
WSLEHLFNVPINDHDPVAQIAMFIAVICNVMFGLSRRMGDLVLGLLTIMLRCSDQRSVIDDIPVTLETVVKKFNLEGKTTTYAVCPTCNCTYPPTFLPGSDV